MKKKSLYLIVLLLLADIVYSYNQHEHTVLDGDMSWIIVPATGYQDVLLDPFGLSVLREGKSYTGSNRFWAHWSLSRYFKQVPRLLQPVFNPIKSVYISMGLAKTAIQVLILFMIASFIILSKSIRQKNLLLAALILTPLFQASGYTLTMGIIDLSITYTFFYALSLGLLLVFLYPFYRAETDLNYQPGWLYRIVLLALIIILSFHGPLVPGVVLLICPGFLLYKWVINFDASDAPSLRGKTIAAIKNLPKWLVFYFGLFSALCLYSLYIGTSNYENSDAIPVIERFQRMPLGLYELLTQNPGFPIFFAMMIINFVLLYRNRQNPDAARIIRMFKWVGIFALLYLLLLPFGGYRSYRPNIIRRDTFMPVTLCLFFLYGISTYYLLQYFSSKSRKGIYIALVIIFSSVFMIADAPINNPCERKALEKLAQSPEKVVRLDCDCTVMSWGMMSNPDDSKWNAELIRHWNITKEQKLYFQQCE